MAADFDPYADWLEIPPAEQPPHYYRLLGLATFETDRQRIEAAAEARMALLRTFQIGRRADASQRLLNEVAAAKLCLLNPATKATYDVVLRATLSPPAEDPLEQLPLPAAAPPSARPAARPTSWPATSQPETPQPGPVSLPAAQSFTITTPNRFHRESKSTFPVRLLSLIAFILGSAGLTAFILWSLANQNTEPSSPAQSVQNPARPTPANPKAPPIPANVVRQSADGDVRLPAARAQLHGPGLKYLPAKAAVTESEASNAIVGWTSPQAAVSWEFWVETPGTFSVAIEYASRSSPDRRFTVTHNDYPIPPQNVRDTGGWNTFETQQLGQIKVAESGRHVIRVEAKGVGTEPLMNLRSVRLSQRSRNP